MVAGNPDFTDSLSMQRVWLRVFLGLALGLAQAGGAAHAQVLLAEFEASNAGHFLDEDGEASDWIELANPSPHPVNLAGWSLSDDAGNATKWRFPARTLGPAGRMLVFASGKDRREAGRPLHTNFKLAADGGVLWLTPPDGQPGQTANRVDYPPQLTGISFTRPDRMSTRPLVDDRTPGRLRTDEAMDSSAWRFPGYDDSAWTPIQGGIGMDRAEEPERAKVLVADSADDFSDRQGFRGWSYGYYDRTADTVAGFTAADVQLFGAPETFWTGGGWRWPVADAARLEVGSLLQTPNGVNQGHEMWAIRRWRSPFEAPVSVEWQAAKVDRLGTGVTVRLHHNDSYLSSTLILGDEMGMVQRTNAIATVRVGDTIDLTVLPQGRSGVTDGRGDAVQVRTRVYATLSLTNLAPTDLSPLVGAPTSVCARYPFLVPSGQPSTALFLRVRYSDGFVAWLNGVEVARANAPGVLAGNVTATASRSLAEALTPVEFDLSAFQPWLVTGTNILAIQGLRQRPDAPAFLLAAELRSVSLTCDESPWQYNRTPSPGYANGLADPRLGPLARDVWHRPKQPVEGQELGVSVAVTPTFAPVTGATLVYRVMFGAETRLPMADDGLHGDGAAGDGVFRAVIPGALLKAGQMVRYAVEVVDEAGGTNRSPAFTDGGNSPQYYGTVTADLAITSALPVLHWFIQSPTAADGTAGGRGAIFFKGEFYDNVRAYLHGQSSVQFPKKSYNFDLNSGDHFRFAPDERRVKKFNLLTTYPDKAGLRNVLAYETIHRCGQPGHVAFPVRVQRNGAFYSVAHWVEDGDEDFLTRVGLDPQGALYKVYDNLSSTGSAEKKTRKTENKADLQALIRGVQLTGTARTQFLYNEVNVPAILNYLASMALISNTDIGHKNYYAYRDTLGTGQWTFLPWDVDLSFGRNWTTQYTYYDDRMFTNNSVFTTNGNLLLDALLAVPEIRQMYVRRLRTLMDELIQPPDTPVAELRLEQRIRELSTLLEPDAALDLQKWSTWGQRQTLAQAVAILTNVFQPARRAYLFNTLSVTRQGPIPLSQPADAGLRFGNILSNPISGNQAEEYLELVNPHPYAVDASFWQISGAVDYTLPPGTVVPAGKKACVSPDLLAFRRQAIDPRGGQGGLAVGNYSGRLSNRGGQLWLRDQFGRLVAASGAYAPSPSLAQETLRVTEIMYHPAPVSPGDLRATDDYQFLTLKNTGTRPVPLSGVRFEAGITFAFSNQVASLPPGGTVVLARDPEACWHRYGGGTNVVGPFFGTLAHGGERVRLLDSLGEVILDFVYDPAWQPMTDGTGCALAVVNEATPWDSWGVAENWQSACTTGNRDWLAWQNDFFTYTERNQPAISGLEADPDGDGADNWSEFVAGTDPRDPSSKLALVLENQPDDLGPRLLLRFEAVPGRSYSVQWSDAPGLGLWWRLTNLPSGGPTGKVAVGVPFGSDRPAFFRVVTPSVP